MILSLVLSIGCAVLTMLTLREHRRAMARRHGLLDNAGQFLTDMRRSLSADGHPVVNGRAFDGRRVTLDLVADTMVTRRLPQLWLRVTRHHDEPIPCPSLGILARPAGSEYYAAVHGLEHWLEPPVSDVPLLMRGDLTAKERRWAELVAGLADLVSDTRVKEAVVTPNAVRVILQAAEGERSTHVLLRQARFTIDSVPAETIDHGLALAVRLGRLAEDSAARTLYDHRKTA